MKRCVDSLILRADVCWRAGQLRELLTGLAETCQTTQNWPDAIAVYAGIKNNVHLKFRAAQASFVLSRKNWTYYHKLRKILLSRNISYVSNNTFRFSAPDGALFELGDDLDPYASAAQMMCHEMKDEVFCEVNKSIFLVPFPHGLRELKEVFVDKIYGEPSCLNATVVDVGAFIGDTAIFYANRGARRVIAFEPVPMLFSFLNRNVAINGLQEVVQTRNEAIGDVNRFADIQYTPARPGSSGQEPLIPGQTRVTLTVPFKTLSEVIHEVDWVDILKMDCEGCEHKALLEAARMHALRNVGMMALEVHRHARSIAKLLQDSGFTITRLLRLGEETWILNAHQL